MSDAKSTFGGSIWRNTSIGGTTFAKVAEILEFKMPQLKREFIEVTNHDSDNWREFIKALCELGEANLKVNWLEGNATHNSSTGLLSDFFEDELYRWRVVTKSGAYMEFSGGLSTADGNFPTSAAQVLEVTLKCSGKPTFSGL